MTYWKCSTGLPPSGPREVKALVCQWSSKGCVAKPLSLICCWNTHTSVLCPWISPDKCHPAVSNSNVKQNIFIYIFIYAWCCDFCLACCCVRERSIASHLFEIWNNCYLSELVSHSMGACEPVLSFQLFSFPVKVLDFLKWREQFEIFYLSLKIDETWHMCLGGSGNI